MKGEIITTATGGSPLTALAASAQNVWVGFTPDANFDTLTAGEWTVFVTYRSYEDLKSVVE